VSAYLHFIPRRVVHAVCARSRQGPSTVPASGICVEIIMDTSTDVYATRQQSARKHWYRLHCRVCVACGREEIRRERVYGEKPKDWYEAHVLDEYFCDCML
jgi:hypothetical protein